MKYQIGVFIFAVFLLFCTGAYAQDISSLSGDDHESSVVYFTEDISSDGLMKVYRALEQQIGGGGPGPQLGDLLGVLLEGVLHPPVVPLDGVDLLHGDGVEAHGVLQFAVVVKQGDPHGHDVFVGVVDGLGGADLFLLADDLRRDAGGEGAVCLQLEGGLAHDGVVGEAEILLIGLTDPQDDAVGVGHHHVVCQHQIVLRSQDLQQSLQVDALVVEGGEGRDVRHGQASYGGCGRPFIQK